MTIRLCRLRRMDSESQPVPSTFERILWRGSVWDSRGCVVWGWKNKRTLSTAGRAVRLSVCAGWFFEDRVPTCAKRERMFLEWKMLCGCVAVWSGVGSTIALLLRFGALPCGTVVCGTLPSVICLVERLVGIEMVQMKYLEKLLKLLVVLSGLLLSQVAR